MPSAREDIDEARMLIDQANLEGRCLAEAIIAAQGKPLRGDYPAHRHSPEQATQYNCAFFKSHA
jgi:hypothetical protein